MPGASLNDRRSPPAGGGPGTHAAQPLTSIVAGPPLPCIVNHCYHCLSRGRRCPLQAAAGGRALLPSKSRSGGQDICGICQDAIGSVPPHNQREEVSHNQRDEVHLVAPSL